MDLSGWLPEYIDDQLLHYAGTTLREKVVFGTDYPTMRPGEWLSSFAEDTDFDEDTQRKVLFENAEDFFGLDPA
jgi:predicted TIM-barrel fold metal-dependent hydrolase